MLPSGAGGRIFKDGSGTLTLTGANTYSGSTNVVNVGLLLVNNSTGSGTGSGPVFVNNFGSRLGGIGTIAGAVTVNEAAVLLGGENYFAASGSLTLAGDVTLNPGAIVQVVLGSSGAHSSLNRTGGTWAFDSNQAFSFVNLGAQPGVYNNIITGLAGDPGTEAWTIMTPGFEGFFSYDGGGNVDLHLTAVPAPTFTSLGNISTRLRVEQGENALIGGFIVTGTQPKKVLVRAIGPSLPFADSLADPILDLRNSIGQTLDGNDNWRHEQDEEIIATGIPPTNDLEAAIVASLVVHRSTLRLLAGRTTGLVSGWLKCMT